MSRGKSLISPKNSQFFLGAVAVPGCPCSPLERARQVFAEVGAGVPSCGCRRNCTSCQTFAQKACWLHNPPARRHRRASRHFGKQLLVTGAVSKTPALAPVYPGCFSGAGCCPTGWWAFCECGPGLRRWEGAAGQRVGPGLAREWGQQALVAGPASLPRVGATTCAARGVHQQVWSSQHVATPSADIRNIRKHWNNTLLQEKQFYLQTKFEFRWFLHNMAQ